MNDLAKRTLAPTAVALSRRTQRMPQPRCDRCDGTHVSTECPHFKWPRATHKDARCMPVEERPALAPDVAPVEASGKLIKQPGDGSCLYHSLSRGERELGQRGTPHAELRRELAMWVKSNGVLPFNGKTVSAWLESELGRPISVAAYAKQQAVHGWGGPLEILAFVLLKKVNVWVWVPLAKGRYRRTSCFNVPHGQKEVGTINISHTAGVHYDWLQLTTHEFIGSLQAHLRALKLNMVSAHVHVPL